MTTTGGDFVGPALVCRVRAIRVAIPLQNVVETMRPLLVEPFAGTPSFVRGLAVIRGLPTPVVDLGALLTSDQQAATVRFVTLRVGERRVAVAVEGVEGIRELSPREAPDLPPLLEDANAGVVAAVRALDDELLVVLAATKIIPEPVWNRLEKGGDAV